MKLRATIALGAVMVGLSALGITNVDSRADAATPTTAPTTPAVVSVAPSQFGDLRAGQPLRLFLTMDDRVGNGIAAGTAVVSVDRRPFTSRSGLRDWFSGKTKASLASTHVAHPATTEVLAGGSHTMVVTVPTSALKFGAGGVYAVAVTVTSNGATVGSARTAVAWKTTGSETVPVALAAPLTVPADSGGFLSAKTLEADTAPAGVLTRELDDLQDTQVAIGIDPRILASIRILGKSAPQSAKDWLSRLEGVSNDTFPLAWADADLTAALQAGATSVPIVKPLDYAIEPSQFAPVPAATTTPTATATPDPNNPPLPTSQSLTAFDYTLPDLSWPAENTVASADAVKLQNSGIAAAILSSTNVKRPATHIPAGASASVGDLSVAVSDADISGYLRAAASATTREAWTAAMAELTTSVALFGDESDGNANALFATFGRNWQDADANFGPTLTGMFTRPWVTSSTLADATSAKAQKVSIASTPQSSGRIARVREMLAAERREVRFSVVTAPDEQTLTSSRRLILLSLLSNEWFADPTGWKSATTEFLDSSRKITTSVQVVKSSDVLLLGDQVSIPITISNTLDQPVTVYIAVRPRTTLIAVDKDHRLQEITVNAQSQRTARIPIQSLSNGKVKVRVSLYSKSGRHLGTTTAININVQAGWETIGTLVFGALVVGIFAFGLVRNIRKRRKESGEPVDQSAREPTVD